MNMKRLVSGIQSSGSPHLGNYLGAMKNHVEMQESNDSYIFIADLHALTTVRDPEQMRKMTLEIAIDYLALGLDPKKTTFFRQSDIPEHPELAWILSTIAPFGLLDRAHAWKDAQEKGVKDPTVGLFFYPVLMAADILIYKPDLVPVGKDQKQHVEITRDIRDKFNHMYGNVFPSPEPLISKDTGYVVGTDGENKMSKSKGNVIEFFADDKTLKNQVMSVVTDSTPVEQPKAPAKCAIFKLYSHFATPEEKEELGEKYRAGGFGYGHAKQALLAKLLEYFGPARQKRIELTQDLEYVEQVLNEGAKKARKVAQNTLNEVREKVGLSFK